jgi:hypothetical protein
MDYMWIDKMKINPNMVVIAEDFGSGSCWFESESNLSHGTWIPIPLVSRVSTRGSEHCRRKTGETFDVSSLTPVFFHISL